MGIEDNFEFFLGDKGKESVEYLDKVMTSADESLQKISELINSFRGNIKLGRETLAALDKTRQTMAEGYDKGLEILKRLKQLGIVK